MRMKTMDTVERREWLYTQSDDAVVAEICGLEAELMEIENRLIELLKSVAPQCEPGETVMGLYWQVDNYIAGQKQENAALRVLVQDLAEFVDYHVLDSIMDEHPLLKEIMEAAK